MKRRLRFFSVHPNRLTTENTEDGGVSFFTHRLRVEVPSW